MSLRQAAEKALEALEYSFDGVHQEYLTDWRHGLPSREAQLAMMREAVERHDAAITALRAALAEADEPVAYLDEGLGAFYWPTEYEKLPHRDFVPLYTNPPRREPFTEEFILELYRKSCTGYDEIIEFARTLERAHGIGGDE